jgi:predicted dienelactone hydrolase
MRPFEIILLLLLAFFSIQLIARWRLPAWAYRVLPLAAIGAAIVHALVEQTRWQMVPTYVLATALALYLFYRRDRALSTPRAVSILLVPLGLVAAALPMIFPVARLPGTTGPYAVGTTAYQWDDASRPEIYTARPDDVRQIMVQFWYPAQASPDASTAPFFERIETAGPILSRRFGLPGFTFDHTVLIRTASMPDAPLLADPPKFPVLVFSPGYNSMRTQSTTLMEEMASHGYVVVALDHTYSGVLTNFPAGRVELLDPNILPDRELIGEERYREKSLAVGDMWEKDVSFVLTRLTSGEVDSRFAGRLDLDRIGLFGHSTGGGTISRLCTRDTRCKAGVGMDAWLGVAHDEMIDAGSDQPMLFLMSERWPTPENNARMQRYRAGSAQVTWLTIARTDHYDFTDLPFLTPLATAIGLAGETNSYRVQEIVRAYTRAFFDLHLGQHLKGTSSPLFQQPAPEFPEVRFEPPAGAAQAPR